MRKTCPSCQKSFKIARNMQDQMVQCPHCAAEVAFLSREPKYPRARRQQPSAQNGGSVTAQPPVTYVSSTSSAPNHPYRTLPVAGRPPSQYDNGVHFISDARPSTYNFAHSGFRCPRCSATTRPFTKKRISTAGWVTVAILAVVFFPLFWIGFFMTEPCHACSTCGSNLN